MWKEKRGEKKGQVQITIIRAFKFATPPRFRSYRYLRSKFHAQKLQFRYSNRHGAISPGEKILICRAIAHSWLSCFPISALPSSLCFSIFNDFRRRTPRQILS